MSMSAADKFRYENANAIRIPAGTRSRPCNGATCRELIYDVGKTPVSIAPYFNKHGEQKVPAGIAPTATEDGAGINHFSNCPDRQKFKR